MILDSNIIIYSVKPEFQFIRQIIQNQECSIASITRIEVLGFHNFISTEIEKEFSHLISSFDILSLDENIILESIRLRKVKKMGLADSIIAAIALISNLPLITRNIEDFKHISDLKIINPFDKFKYE